MSLLLLLPLPLLLVYNRATLLSSYQQASKPVGNTLRPLIVVDQSVTYRHAPFTFTSLYSIFSLLDGGKHEECLFYSAFRLFLFSFLVYFPLA